MAPPPHICRQSTTATETPTTVRTRKPDQPTACPPPQACVAALQCLPLCSPPPLWGRMTTVVVHLLRRHRQQCRTRRSRRVVHVMRQCRQVPCVCVYVRADNLVRINGRHCLRPLQRSFLRRIPPPVVPAQFQFAGAIAPNRCNCHTTRVAAAAFPLSPSTLSLPSRVPSLAGRTLLICGMGKKPGPTSVRRRRPPRPTSSRRAWTPTP